MSHDTRDLYLLDGQNSPYDPQNKMSGQFADEKYRNIYFDNTDPIAMGTWSSPQEDPTWMSGHRRYGAAKLCEVMMMCVRLLFCPRKTNC